MKECANCGFLMIMDVDAMDDDVEVIAWKPLPESYKVESEG